MVFEWSRHWNGSWKKSRIHSCTNITILSTGEWWLLTLMDFDTRVLWYLCSSILVFFGSCFPRSPLCCKQTDDCANWRWHLESLFGFQVSTNFFPNFLEFFSSFPQFSAFSLIFSHFFLTFFLQLSGKERLQERKNIHLLMTDTHRNSHCYFLSPLSPFLPPSLYLSKNVTKARKRKNS